MQYWTIIDDRHAGPFTADQLLGMGLRPDSPVWTAGLPDWVEAAEIEELRLLLEQQQAPAEIPAEESYEPAQAAPEEPNETQQAAPEPTYEAYGESPQPDARPYAEEPAQQFEPPYEPCDQPAQPQWEWQREAVIPDQPCPPTYLVWSIIVTIICCVPFGIAAIIFSAQVKQAYRNGNLAKAEKMSEWAQWMIILSIVFGLVALPLQIIFMGLS